MALPLFAVTLFVSAFFLFLVQPIVGKIILPKLGGTPQVWNTCMVFFQTVLVAGYAYSHTVSTRLSQRQQLIVHCLLMLTPFVVLLAIFPTPFSIEGWTQSSFGANPMADTLTWLATRVGLPFIVVATSAPLLQKWFAGTGHEAAKDPYFLYGASNLGSLLSLLLYPVAVEPWLGLTDQAYLFTGGYALLVILVFACCALVWTPFGRAQMYSEPVPSTEIPPAPNPTVASDASSTAVKKGAPRPSVRPGKAAPAMHRTSDEVTGWRRLRWIGLAAVPTSFMLGVTTHITTDLSPIPLFWLVPLTLYLLSFILVYARWPVVWVEGPHQVALVLQPVALAIMIFVEILGLSSNYIWVAVFFNLLAFFLTALVCHGELAKDRPSTKHLTEYYLLMSVGGMVGGMFNGLLAPVLFKRVIEFNVAIFLACMLRPTMKEEGWTDTYLVNMLEQKHRPQPKPQVKGKPGAPLHVADDAPSYAIPLDFVLPLLILVLLAGTVFMWPTQIARLASKMTESKEAAAGMRMFLTYGLPLAIVCFYFARPIRFGLAIGTVLLMHSLYTYRHDPSIYADRSYFGIIRVKKGEESIKGVDYPFNQLIHGHINHGMNFLVPENKKDRGNPAKDFSRLATTYYHRFGPAGRVMEKFNWNSDGDENTYHADARMPLSLLGALGGDLTAAPLLPVSTLVDLWSEPPFATIGLGTGTMASYSRPFQHCHYYEIDNAIRKLSLPEEGGELYFNYLEQAKKRGAEVQVLMGDARLRMALPYVNHHDTKNDGPTRGGGPDNFYHMMVVDAFSSDAIPVHLITKEALELYFTKLTKEGILCVHTSNRFVNLPLVVAAVAKDLKFAYQTGKDSAPFEDKTGHYTSEWVMVARDAEYLKKLSTPKGYRQAALKKKDRSDREYWSTSPPAFVSRFAWTDDHSNLLMVLRGMNPEWD